MKYIEELNNGEIFAIDQNFYVLSSDFKIDKKTKKTKHMCVQIKNGCISWFESDQITSDVPIFYQDSENVLHQMEFKSNEKN